MKPMRYSQELRLQMITVLIDPYTGEIQESESLYPDRISGREPMPGHEAFPIKTKRVYLETSKPSTADTASRRHRTPALIESICLEQKTKSKILLGNRRTCEHGTPIGKTSGVSA